ncbi:MAG: hypothetical protein ACOX78_03265 [Lachnospiraceae bacterium]
MFTQTMILDDRECQIQGDEEPSFVLIQPVDDHDREVLDEEWQAIRAAGAPSLLVTVPVLDWGRELLPWKAKLPFGLEPDSAEAGAMLSRITGKIVPALKKSFADVTFVIGGYSLAGLFALWSSYQTDLFAGCAAASPSLWVEGWLDYARENAPLARYYSLSLGDREERAKNPVLKTIGECMRRQDEILESDCVTGRGNIRNVQFQMNPGNHFQHNGKRTGDAFTEVIRMSRENP